MISSIEYGDGTKPTQVKYKFIYELPKDRFGAFDVVNGKHVITVSPGQTRQNEMDSILHEILHDAAERAGVRKLGITMTQEELFIGRVAPWLLEALVNNPDLRRLFEE